MSKLWLVAQYEFRRLIAGRGFLFGTLSIPLLAVIIWGVLSIPKLLQGEDSPSTVGYVDMAGFLERVEPPQGEDVTLVSFDDEAAASAALGFGGIDAYFLVPANYRTTHRVDLISPDEPDQEVTRSFQRFLRQNLLADQPEVVSNRLTEGVNLTVRLADGRREFSGKINLGHILPALSGLILVTLIFLSSGYLMDTVQEEKTSRTMEVLMTSLSAKDIMVGKLLGTLAITFTQFVIWFLFGYLIVFVGGTFFGVEWLQNLRMDPGSLLTLAALLIPAYVFASALMVGIGAALDDSQTGQYISVLIISVYLTPMVIVPNLLFDLSSPVAVTMSILPFTSPVVLPLRMTFTQVPFWQITMSIALQSILAFFGIWLASRSLSLGMLRYSKRLKWRMLFGRDGGERLVKKRGIENFVPERVDMQKGRRKSVRYKTFTIFGYELRTTFTKPLYYLTVIGLPLLVGGQLYLFEAAIPGSRSSNGPTDVIQETLPAPEDLLTEAQGIVDESGVVNQVPGNLPDDMMSFFPSQAAAQQALDSGEIAAYSIIPVDFLETGSITTVRPDYHPLSHIYQTRLMNWVVLVNGLDGDLPQANLFWNPMDLRTAAISTAISGGQAESTGAESGDDDFLEMLLPSLVMLLVYGVILMSASLLLANISDEKKNRVMETLLVSINPRQMLAGKILAVGVLSFFQALVWIGMGYGLGILLGNPETNSFAGMQFHRSVILWGLVYLVLGYLVYGSLMAGAGALMPDAKKSRSTTFLLALPALIGFEVAIFSVNAPHALLPTFVSLFPLTAPFVMIQRLVIGGVPFWQPWLGAVIMIAFAYMTLIAVSKMFRAQNLLSGQPFRLKSYFRVLLGRAA